MEITTLAHEHKSHPQKQVKALSSEEKAMCEHDLKTLLSSLDQSSFQKERGKVENHQKN